MAECRDLFSLQALICSTIYLQGSGQLQMCYTYLSLATTAAIRMGMHQADSLLEFNVIERETRRRVFWTLRVMDSYITTVLDLPRTLRDEDTDQAYPKDVDDIYVTLHGVKRTNEPCLMATINAHTRLTRILAKVKQIAEGSKEHEHKPHTRYQVDFAGIVEAEQELAEWTSTLPVYTKFPEHIRRDMERFVAGSSHILASIDMTIQSTITPTGCARSRSDGPLSSFFTPHRSEKVRRELRFPRFCLCFSLRQGCNAGHMADRSTQ